MTRTYTYPQSAFVGFDRLFNQLNSVNDSIHSGYPPHNVVKVDEDHFDIELAVAGISMDSIQIELKENTLTIQSTPQKRDVEYLYRGISEKQFTKTFTLHEHVIVDGAELIDGILKISLRVEVPEEKKPRKIEITGQKQLLTE